MNIEDLISLFRKQVGDTESPPLWDDDEIFSYLVDAQDMLVRSFGGISDSTTPAITNLAVVPGVAFAKFSPYILRIRSGRLVGARRDVPIISESDAANRVTVDYGELLSTTLNDDDTGPVRQAIIGLDDKKLRWVKVPEAADTFKMHVYRLPYPRLQKEDDPLEVDEQHHIHLLKWMKHLAYSKEDAETYDVEMADKNKDAFDLYCEKVRQETERQRYKPRIVHYGGL